MGFRCKYLELLHKYLLEGSDIIWENEQGSCCDLVVVLFFADF